MDSAARGRQVGTRAAEYLRPDSSISFIRDDPELDGTDWAHPAWWRGEEAGVFGMADIVNDWLDGKRFEGSFSSSKLNTLRERFRKPTVSMAHIDSLRTKANDCLDVVRNSPYRYDSFAQAVAVTTYWNLYEQIEILLRIYRKEHNV